MNVYDAQRMADVLAPEGYQTTHNQNEADLVILNTCHIREKASEKVFSELGRVKDIKTERAQQGHNTHVVVAGCVAQAEGKEILRRSSIVDVVVGPQSYQHLPRLLQEAKSGRRPVETEFPVEDKFDALPHPSTKAMQMRGVSAFLTVQEGCDKFCSFCVVPYTRGAEFSRPVAKILEDARRLLDAGVKEFTLIGQNVNAYHGEGPDGNIWTLARLLETLATLPGVLRLRYSTSHPCDMTDDLIMAHRDNPVLMPSLHLPVQAGSDRILKAMNRRHTADDYRRIIDHVRQMRPDIAVTSDFIIGFPGETDQDFEDTLRLIDNIGFTAGYYFKYSPRPGTPAAERDDAQVLEETMNERLHRLQDKVEGLRHAYNTSMIGRTLDVLIEKPGKYQGQMTGKTPYLQQVQVNVHQDGRFLEQGQVVAVPIVSMTKNTLFGAGAEPHSLLKESA